MTIEVPSNVSLADAVDAFFDSILSPPRPNIVNFQIHPILRNWEPMQIIDVFFRHRIKTNTLQTPFFGEPKLLQMIRFMEPRKLLVTSGANDSFSDAFFKDPMVRNLQDLSTPWSLNSQLTEETLLKLNATHLNLGHAPKISFAAASRFLWPALIGKMDRRTLSWWPADAVVFNKEDFLQDINVTSVSTPFSKADFWRGVDGPPEVIIHQTFEDGRISLSVLFR